jgi:hypothetical protein
MDVLEERVQGGVWVVARPVLPRDRPGPRLAQESVHMDRFSGVVLKEQCRSWSL